MSRAGGSGAVDRRVIDDFDHPAMPRNGSPHASPRQVFRAGYDWSLPPVLTLATVTAVPKPRGNLDPFDD